MPELPPIFHPYTQWEDWGAGMYGFPKDLKSETSAARALLCDPVLLEAGMTEATVAYPSAAEHQLSDYTQNRRSWLGQAACHVSAHATAIATRAAWGQLTDDDRAAANACADRVIASWELDHLDTEPLF
jgi:hypothetical protein